MNTKFKINTILNSIIVIDTLVTSMIGIIYGAGSGQVGNYIIGFSYLKPYTMDSNILAAIVALMLVVYCIKNRRQDSLRIPRWLMNAYLMATTSLIVTFIVTAAFLAPMKAMAGFSYFVMFSGDMFFFHLVNPLLATISLVVLMRDGRGSFSHWIVGMIPTGVYSLVYLLLVVVFKVWEDFYHFTFGGRYYMIPVVIVVIDGMACIISWALARRYDRARS